MHLQVKIQINRRSLVMSPEQNQIITVFKLPASGLISITESINKRTKSIMAYNSFISLQKTGKYLRLRYV